MTTSKDKPVKKGLFEYCEIILDIISPPFIWIYRYFGGEFIVRKFYPPKNSGGFPTGFIWLIGLHVALFGIAFQRYENRTLQIDNLVNGLTAQLATERRRSALSRIPHIQWQLCPLRPEIFKPKSVYLSLFGDYRQYEEQVDYLKNIIVDHRDLLSSANLGRCDLRGTVFQGGNFENSNLMYSKLDQSIFSGVNFKNAKFFNAKFNKAWFAKCNFKGANLNSVDFEGTIFQECNLEEAKGIKLDQLLKCRSLYQCKLKPRWLEVIKKEYPKLMEWQSDLGSSDEFKVLMKRVFPPSFQKIFKEHTSD